MHLSGYGERLAKICTKLKSPSFFDYYVVVRRQVIGTLMNIPKVFISYSWSNPVHEQWVLDLATELRESSVDVILDKWDLKEGHDAIAFMEKMVTDPEIKKVVIVTDEVYASKADGRAGGVGTETQIISKEIYENQEQDKFVSIVTKKDAQGNPYLPTC